MYIDKKEKIKVGIFVFSGIFIIILALIYIIGLNLKKNTNHYYIIFQNESVQGLTRGSFIKYQGVDIGKVKNISISKKDINSVRVDVDIDKNIELKQNMYAILNILGITGLKYIEITGGTNNAKSIKINGKIPSKKSVFSNITDKMDEIAVNAANLLYNLNALTNDSTKLLIKQSLKNINSITNDVKSFSTIVKPQIESTFVSLNKSLLEITPVVKNLKILTNSISNENFLNGINKAIKNSNNILTNVDSSIIVLKKAIKTNNSTIDQKRNSIVNIINSLENVTNNLEHFSKDIKNNPSILLRGKKDEKRR